MIEVKNLTKIYKSKNKETCVAVNDVSFVLEEKGFVFIIGKSGSGKTTLLSLIGGLDNITSGNIIINGNHFDKFKYKDFINYRNSMIGYIFQDFHLIDELTIKENIALSLQLQNKCDDGKISNSLKQVDLAGYEQRYPRELSGGEKQRVAIARALVKDPKVILADEPTGNLDSKTTKQVMSLLKELSKERLVIIVSHNLNDAKTYADRIIELSAGKIINDYDRNKDFDDSVKVENETLYLPFEKLLNDEERNYVDERLQEGKIKKLIQPSKIFIKHTEKEVKYTEEKIENHHISLKNNTKLSFKFIKKDFLRMFIYSFVVACLVVILGLSQLIVNFNSSEVIKKEMGNINQTSVSFTKNEIVDSMMEVDKNKIININKDDIEVFKQSGYDGNIYELVNVVLDYGISSSLSSNHTPTTFYVTEPFYSGTKGTLITTENYVKQVFGELEYVELAETIHDGGLYITDYSADGMLHYNLGKFTDYKSLLGYHKSMAKNTYAYVNGIIKTGYKEKYQSIMDKLQDINLSDEEIKEITSTKEYREYIDDVVQNLSISYTFNPNFVDDFVNLGATTWCPAGNAVFISDGIRYESPYFYFENAAKRSNYQLNDNEVVMKLSLYNQIFNKNYTSQTIDQFVPHEATYQYYYYYDAGRVNLVHSTTIKIVKLVVSEVAYFADNLFKEILKINSFTSGIYFDNINEFAGVLSVAEENGFAPNSVVAISLSTMTKAVNVFSEFFNIIFIGLCICSFLIIANYGLKLIKDRKYEIGILKALGTRDRDLFYIFGIHVFLVILIIIALYIIGSVLFIDLSNDILINSLSELANDRLLLDVDMLYIKGDYLLNNSLLVVLIVIISFILPLINMRRLKPTNIIKAKE